MFIKSPPGQPSLTQTQLVGSNGVAAQAGGDITVNILSPDGKDPHSRKLESLPGYRAVVHNLTKKIERIECYIDLSARRFRKTDNDSQLTEVIPSVADHVANAACDRTGTKEILLGHYGSGKTSGLLEGLRRMADIHPNDLRRRPVFISLNIYTKLPTWDDLRTIACNSWGYPNADAVEEAVASDSIILLLDGLDEVPGEPGKSRSEILQELVEILPNGISFVTTSRPSAFLQYDDMVSSLSDDYYAVTHFLFASTFLEHSAPDAYMIDPVSRQQIDDHFNVVCSSSEDINFARYIVNQVYDLEDLARRPILLGMIVHCLPQLRKLLRKKGPKAHVAAGYLYLAFTDNWLESPNRPANLSKVDRTSLLQNVAVDMWLRNVSAISATELEQFIQDSSTGLSAIEIEGYRSDLATCTFLDLERNGLEFSHRSFMEFFVARSCVSDIFSVQPQSPLLLVRCLDCAPSQSEVTDFASDLASMKWSQTQAAEKERILQCLDTSDRESRSHAAHLFGHVGAQSQDPLVIEKIVTAFDKEKDPWVRRTLALSAGRAGRQDIIDNYVRDELPSEENRFINLQYHFRYYGSSLKAAVAVIRHLTQQSYWAYLCNLDVFTLGQIARCEPPMSESDQLLARLVSRLIPSASTGSVDDTLAEVQCIGYERLMQALFERNPDA